MEFFVVGLIQNTHGLKGELKIKNLSDFERFEKGKTLYIEYKQEYLAVRVLAAKFNDGIYLVRFEGLEDINLVEKYKGSFIYIEKSEMGLLEENEFYFHELIGKAVVNQLGVKKGQVIAIREVPQGHLLVVDVAGKNKLVPFRNEFIKEVGENNIIVNEIEGLL